MLRRFYSVLLCLIGFQGVGRLPGIMEKQVEKQMEATWKLAYCRDYIGICRFLGL